MDGLDQALAADQGGVIPSVPRFQALREAPWMVRDPVGVLSHHGHALGDLYSYHFGGGLKYLVTTRPAFIIQVLKKKSDHFFKSEIQTERMQEFLGKGLLTLHGEHWRKQRKQIQLGFRPDHLTASAPIMFSALEEGLARFDALAADGPVDAAEEMTRLTFAMVARSLFGAAIPMDDIAHVSQVIAEVQHFIVRRIVQPYLGPWFQLSGAIRHYQGRRRSGDAVLMRHIVARQESGDRGDDLLQVLLDARYPETGEPMTRTQLLAESMQLLVAGHETSSTTVGWALYRLCQNPEMKARVHAEIVEALGEAPYHPSDAAKLPFTTNVLKETLRHYPAFWMVDRMVEKPVEIDGHALPVGARVACFFHGVHRNPAFWSEPERFLPDRFDGEERFNERAGAYVPFGAGPRVCIGRGFAMIQMLMVMAEIMRRYEFELVHDRPIEPDPMLILRPAGGIPMRFVPRRR